MKKTIIILLVIFSFLFVMKHNTNKKLIDAISEYETRSLIYTPCIEYINLDDSVNKQCDKYFERTNFPVEITIREFMSSPITLSKTINSIDDIVLGETVLEMKRLDNLYTTIAINPINMGDTIQLTNDVTKEFKIYFELAGKIETKSMQFEVGTRPENIDITSYIKVESNSIYSVNSNFNEFVNLNLVGTYDFNYTVELEKETKEITMSVSVVDTTLPEIEVNPNNLTTIFEIRSAKPNWLDYFKVTDNYDGIIVITSSMINDNVNMNNIGNYSVGFEVTDENGNTATSELEIIVVDTVNPFIVSLQSNIEIEVGTTYESIDWLVYIIAADTSGIYEIIENIKEVVDFALLGEYTVSYTVIDSAGNYVTASTTVKVIDTKKPKITLLEETLSIEIYSNYSDIDWLSLISIIDNYDSLENVTVVENAESTINFSRLGVYTVTYTATDTSNNSAYKALSVSIVDTTKPIIEVLVEVIYIALGTTSESIDWTSYVNVTDNSGVYIITNNARDILDFENLKIGEYIITYTATDESNNKATLDIKVEVIKTFDISINRDINIIIDVFSVYEEIDWKGLLEISHYKYTIDELTLTDNINFIVNFNIIGAYEVSFLVANVDGDSTEKKLTVEIVDREAPIFEKLKDEILITNESTADKNLILKEIVIIDNHSTREKITVDIIGDYNLLVNGEYEVSIVATDESGNSTVETVKIIVEQNGTYAKYIMLGAVCLLVIGGGLIAAKKFS